MYDVPVQQTIGQGSVGKDLKSIDLKYSLNDSSSRTVAQNINNKWSTEITKDKLKLLIVNKVCL